MILLYTFLYGTYENVSKALPWFFFSKKKKPKGLGLRDIV